jgi:hypothetical protein
MASGPFRSTSSAAISRTIAVLIVENQLTPTDHDHLGKLITYAAGTDAQTVVWLAPSFREEHREALDLLNNLGGEQVRFFGVELSAVRIADSPPAPLLELRVEPNDWHAQLSSVARGVSQGSGSRRSNWSSGRDSFSA